MPVSGFVGPAQRGRASPTALSAIKLLPVSRTRVQLNVSPGRGGSAGSQGQMEGIVAYAVELSVLYFRLAAESCILVLDLACILHPSIH